MSSASINPTVRRRRLGAKLRELREEQHLTAEDVAQQLLVSQSKISRLENGRRSISQRDVRDLCRVYSVTDEKLIDALMAMARESRQRGWWHAFGDVPYSVYIGLEADAVSARNYESLFVPGMLQTREYAAAVIAGIQPEAAPAQNEKRTEIRMRRQEVMHAPDKPLRMWAVLDEAVLHREVGGPQVMREQLEHLIALSQEPHITVQVLPYSVGAHPGMSGTFSILEFEDEADATIVYLEGVTSDLYLEKEADVKTYSTLYEHLRAQALNPDQTRDLIDRIAKDFAR
ncbi:helix-turn-helix domain-containing protein [Streptacidiphilus sp. PB12-B1b]|uniref:helix-turn-helix domain-containing protein n=1 Tax=Streptacidiphilus sp. PB12-B1b TaxID=2705012 RepID=UPI0015F7C132|nr:helix-turn-helix transcriptional regulator [Streptacidiphilus sp. PB12-B1b]QMU75025.1 helix-turn-helix domain-containing protein [Streptacidiphilus sp. PB12-B1b]